MNKIIWITWEKQRRNASMTDELGIELYEIIVNRPRMIRYALSMIRTFKIIYYNKPEIVIVQNPSIVLALFSIILRAPFRYKLIVDEHNAGLYPMEGESRILNIIAKYIVKTADYLIVTNNQLADIVRRWGGNPIILPDPLPKFHESAQTGTGHNDSFEVLAICTWSADEPIGKLIEAAALIKDKITISITGRHGDRIGHEHLPHNVKLTGFLDDHEYVRRLNQCNAVIVLTDRDNCLNCGAYEAVAVEKPLILSDKRVLKEYFNRGVLFTENEPEHIAAKINDVFENSDSAIGEIKALKAEISVRWAKKKAEFVKMALAPFL